MKITVLYNDQPTEVIDVVEALYINNYTIKISFSDSTVQEVDFAPFLNKSRHSSLRKYLDVENFKAFHIYHGNLMWGDYEMIFPVADLWEGKI